MRSIVVLLAFLTSFAYGNEFMCKTPNGKTVIQDTPCSSGAKTTYSNTAEPETRAQMQERERIRALGVQEMHDVFDKANRKAEADAKIRREMDAYDRQAKARAQPQYAPAYEPQQPDIMDEFRNIAHPKAMIPLANDPPKRQKPQPSMIMSCDPGGCWDDVGNRYNGSAGGFFRDDGKFCQQTGSMLQCN